MAGVDQQTVRVYALDWYSESPPTLDDLAAARPLRFDHHAHQGGLAHVNIAVDETPPVDFQWLGIRPVDAEVPAETASYASWRHLQLQVVLQRRWEQVISPAMRTAYKQANANPTLQVTVDFDAGQVRRPLGTSHLDLVSQVPLPSSGPIVWEQLDLLPNLTGLRWRGEDRGLAAAIAARPIISSLTWQQPPATVDLSASQLTDVHLDGDLPGLLRLPPGVLSCALTTGPLGRAGLPQVHAIDAGRHITLTITSPEPLIPAGLRGVRNLSARGGTLAANSSTMFSNCARTSVIQATRDAASAR